MDIATDIGWAQELIEHYGYLAVFVSTLLEGEAVVLAAAAIAQAGLMRPEGVILAAALGAYAGHLAFFAIGRWRGMRLIRAFPSLHRHYPRANYVMDRYANVSVFIFQYLYGMRLISAILFGCSTLSWPRFLLLQALNCLSWAALVFFAGQGLAWLAAWLYARAGLPGVLAGAGLLALGGWWLYRRHGRRWLTAIWRDMPEIGAAQTDPEAGRRALGEWLAGLERPEHAGMLLVRLPDGEAGAALAERVCREIRWTDRAFRIDARWLAVVVPEREALAGLVRRLAELTGEPERVVPLPDIGPRGRWREALAEAMRAPSALVAGG